MYSLIKPLLFKLDAERAHELTLHALQYAEQWRVLPLFTSSIPQQKPIEALGLSFSHAVGLAAGLDKNAAYIDALAALGFAFIEVGTVTPRPQPGNPKPRLFRIPEANAIINRMGFNNAGVEQMVRNIERARYNGILGINIGKNFDTPVEAATQDYVTCLRRVYPYASYVTVNISSPNTKGLRALQEGDALSELLSTLKNEQQKLASVHQRRVPLVLKVAPDLDEAQVDFIAHQLLQHGFEGLIATNTTLAREGVEQYPVAQEAGGLSGDPVRLKSNQCQAWFNARLHGKVDLIGVGGITRAEHVDAKLAAGAQLVQLYSGLIYAGPPLIRACAVRAAQYVPAT